MSEADAFGPWLDRQLRRKGANQADLALDLGVTRAAVSAWVNGRAVPRMDKLRRIETFLGLEFGASMKTTEDTHLAAELGWRHRREHPDGGRELGNAAAFAFEANLQVLAREATQNSLDERLDETRPVRMRFTLHEIRGERLQRFLGLLKWETLEPHYEEAAKLEQKSGRALREGLRSLREEERLLLLRIDDYNAKGLTGNDYGDGRFAAVVRDQLNSLKKDTSAAGSYGLGKATLWAASQLGMVLMNSTLSEPYEGRQERRMIGRLDLPWRRVDGEGWAGPAWFGEPDDRRGDATRSWWADEATAKALYLDRDSADPGTSFLVVGAYDASGQVDSNNLEALHERLAAGLARDFWGAMVAGRDEHPMLVASVTSLRNGQGVTPEERVDPHFYQPARSRALQAFLNDETVPQLTARDDVARATVTLVLSPLKEPDARKPSEGEAPSQHEAVLLLTPVDDSDSDPNRLVCMRGSRMVVRSQRIGDLPLGGAGPFQAVLLAGLATRRNTEDARAAERFLRAAEPPDHNDWRSTEDLTATYRLGAVRRLNDFKNAMRLRAIELVRAPEPQNQNDEGPAVLAQLLRLDRPKAKRSRSYPTVDGITGEVDSAEAWHVRVTVGLPEREDAWVLKPVLKFRTRSGPAVAVEWESLTPERDCEVVGEGLLRFSTGADKAVFNGVSRVSSHPVAAYLARVEVDVRRAQEVAE